LEGNVQGQKTRRGRQQDTAQRKRISRAVIGESGFRKMKGAERERTMRGRAGLLACLLCLAVQALPFHK
jgi:hypothetical protein